MENIYTIKERWEEGKVSNLQYLVSPNCPSEYLSTQFLLNGIPKMLSRKFTSIYTL